MPSTEPGKPHRLVCIGGNEVRTDLHAFGYVELGVARSRPDRRVDLYVKTATLSPEEAEALSVRLHDLAERGKEIRRAREREERRHREATACP